MQWHRQHLPRVGPSQLAEHDWMSQTDTRRVQALGEPAPSVWEPSQTLPLDYPTSTVKRGVNRFHEQVRWQAGLPIELDILCWETSSLFFSRVVTL